jgi:hypothetical protein
MWVYDYYSPASDSTYLPFFGYGGDTPSLVLRTPSGQALFLPLSRRSPLPPLASRPSRDDPSRTVPRRPGGERSFADKGVRGSVVDRPRPEQRISRHSPPPFPSKLERWPTPMGQSRRMWDAGHYLRFRFLHGMRLFAPVLSTFVSARHWSDGTNI